ncbi:hypothetical protein AGMMS50222_07970 [Endomicrobiia bacterium]|nr:hypothetical protein AGMMS49556_08760 [Endomicrobiia bacterium]GHT75990.1 hypothetical protein AGMMS50222_07970 [Endomicrobiia bacterium]
MQTNALTAKKRLEKHSKLTKKDKYLKRMISSNDYGENTKRIIKRFNILKGR